MKRLPTISIVTPSFNQGHFLEDCICSVLDQNYPHLEYIIIDGKSTDNSVEVIEKYAQYLTYWVSERDKGQTDAINKGLKRATGDIVAWLNSDDFYLPDTLHHIAKLYQKTPQASFYFGDGYRVDEVGRIKNHFFPEKPIVYNQTLFTLGMNYVLQPSAFMNADHLKKIDYLNETLHYGMDSDLWIRLAALSEPLFTPQVLSASREYEDTKTSTGLFERIEELRHIAAAHSGLPITPGTLCYFLGTLHQFCSTRETVFPAAYRQAIEQFWGATAQLFQQWGGRMDSFPKKVPLITGIHPDGWIGESLDVYVEPNQQKNASRFIDITLELPASAPTSAVLITSGDHDYILFKEKELTIRQPLKPNQQKIHFVFSPTFQFSAIGVNDNPHKLSCVCRGVKLMIDDDSTVLF